MESARRMLSLDGEWKFAYNKDDAAAKNNSLPEKSEYQISIPVPGFWDDYEERMVYADFWSRDRRINPDYQPLTMPVGSGSPPDMSLPYLVGCGWYKRSFDAEADWKEKRVTLHVGGVVMEAWVWLNGTLIGYHKGHLTPFSFLLGENLRCGKENELIIAVSNICADRVGCSIRGNKGKSGGISRNIKLEVTGKVRLADCFVHADRSLEQLHWQVELEGLEKDIPGEIVWEISDLDRALTMISGSVSVLESRNKDLESKDFICWHSGIGKLEQWSDTYPKLYRIRLTLFIEGNLTDSLEQNFGLRRMESVDSNLYLNQKPLFLRGATDHAYFPKTCTVPTDKSYYIETLKCLKSYGFNWVRFHTWIPPVECLEAADTLGMLLQVEMANGFSEAEWLDAIYTCRRHPSVILYCCGNEVRIDEFMLEYLERMAGYIHRMVPDALFNPMEALRGLEYDIDDEHPGFSEKLFRYDRLERLEQFSDVLSPHGGQFSYHSLQTTEQAAEERLQKYHRPCLIHEAGINDSYLNLDLQSRYEGTRIGTKLYAAVSAYARRMGVLEQTPVYYQNSCRWMKQILKYSLENLRRNHRIHGYDLLGAVDCHWHRSGYACGFLNEFYELKAGFSKDEILSFNNESILLADVGKMRNVNGGECLEVPVYVSLYGKADGEHGVLSWQLAGDNQTVYHNEVLSVPDVGAGRVSELTRLRVVFPLLPYPEKVILRLHYSSEAYQLDNAWEYWVFPAKAPYFGIQHEDGNYVIVEAMDEDVVNTLAEGARVLLLGSGAFPSVKTSFQIMTAGRNQGLNATVIYDHPITRRFPHERYCSWQFYTMLEDGEAVVFDDSEIPFHPIIEEVSGYKLIRKQAGMFELQVGKGKLFICSLKLSKEDSGACYLRQLIENYIVSEEFQPQENVPAEKLLEQCRRLKQLRINFSTDEGYDVNGHVRSENEYFKGESDRTGK